MVSYALDKRCQLTASRQLCYLCGGSGMTKTCPLDECCLSFHPWCSRRYNPFSDGSLCAEHHGNCLTRNFDRYKHLLKKARDALEIRTSRGMPGLRGPPGFCWFVINSIYFPAAADLTQLPTPSQPPVQASETPQTTCYLDREIASTVSQLQDLSEISLPLLNEAQQSPNFPVAAEAQGYLGRPKPSSVEVLVLMELQSKLARKEMKECSRLLEKGRLGDDTTSTNGSVSEAKHGCAVCMDVESLEETLNCARCNLSFHKSCTGLLVVADQDWVCDVCLYMPAKSLPCALCGHGGGAMKRTINRAGSLDLPTHPYSQEENLWVHIFCAKVTPGVSFVVDSKAQITIDLSRLKLEFFKTPCAVCKERTGVVIGCNTFRCTEAFHAECGKKRNIIGKFKDGADQIKVFCNRHRPSSKDAEIALLSKKLAERVLACAKGTENTRSLEERSVKKNKWTRFEQQKLLQMVETYGQITGRQQKFTVEVDLGLRPAVKANFPERAILPPELIKECRLSIPGRTVSQCKAYYSSKLLPRLELKSKKYATRASSETACSLCGYRCFQGDYWKCRECSGLFDTDCLTTMGYGHLLEEPFSCPSCVMKRRKLAYSNCHFCA